MLFRSILLRLGIQHHADFPEIRSAIDQLEARNTPLAYTLQNMTEFWNAATRPVDRNDLHTSSERFFHRGGTDTFRLLVRASIIV